jgi:uncharacterized membrane protein
MMRISFFSVALLLFPVLYALEPGLLARSALTMLTLGAVALAFSLLPVAALCREVFRSTAARPVSRGGIVRW